MATKASPPPVKQGWVITTLVLGAATIFLTVIGLWQGRCVLKSKRCGFYDWTDLGLDAVALLALEPPDVEVENEWFSAARIAAICFAAIAVFTVLFSLSGAFRELLSRMRIGWSSFVGSGPTHTVVFGLGAVGIHLVRGFLKEGGGAEEEIGRRPHVIVVEPDELNPNVREAQRLGALVLIGDARERTIRRRTYLHMAEEVFIVTGDDALNLDIAGEVLKDLQPRRPTPGEWPAPPRSWKTECHVHASKYTILPAFTAHRLLHEPADNVDFHVFNIIEQVARDLLLDPEEGITRKFAPREVAHYFVFGFGMVGQTIALQMARLAHFNTFRRLRLTLMDDFDGAAGGAMRSFLDRYPGFCPDPAVFDLLKHRQLDRHDKDDWGCRIWRPADQDWQIADPRAVEYAANAEFLSLPTVADAPKLIRELLARIEPVQTSEPHLQPVLVICFDEEQRNFEAVLSLRNALELARLDGRLESKLPLYVYLPTERGLTVLKNCPEIKQSGAIDLHDFGAQEEAGTYRRIIYHRKMGSVVMEKYNRRYGSGKKFEDLSPTLQASNVDAAAHVELKLDAIGYHRRKPTKEDRVHYRLELSTAQQEMLAHMEHNRWMAERLCAGWRYGAPPDPEEKEKGEFDNQRRRSFVPWHTLIHEQMSEKEKDLSQVLDMEAILAEVGQIVDKKPPSNAPVPPRW